jgi:hypothetical protein
MIQQAVLDQRLVVAVVLVAAAIHGNANNF